MLVLAFCMDNTILFNLMACLSSSLLNLDSGLRKLVKIINIQNLYGAVVNCSLSENIIQTFIKNPDNDEAILVTGGELLILFIPCHYLHCT